MGTDSASIPLRSHAVVCNPASTGEISSKSRTEVEHFGNIAIIWSTYALEIEVDGKQSPDAGRVTEIFVWRDGHWTNPGWHIDAGK